MYYRRTQGCRISDAYTLHGMRLLTLENELVRCTLLLDKGADVVEFTYKPLDVDLMWHSPAGIRPPHTTLVSRPHPSGNFTDFYPGGWQVLFPSASGPSQYEGAEFGMHGEVCLLAWECTILQDDADEVAARLRVETLRSPFVLERVVRLRRGVAALAVQEQIANLSERSLHYMWGQHIAFGEPLVGPGCRIDMPPGRVLSAPGKGRYSRVAPGAEGLWPFLPGAQGEPVDLRHPVTAPPSGEMLYRAGLTEGWAALVNPQAGVGVGLQWPAERWPCVWIWQELGSGPGYPWYGRARTIALEPFSSLPGTGRAGLEEAIAGGTAGLIGPLQQQSASYQVIAFAASGHQEVTAIGPTGEISWR